MNPENHLAEHGRFEDLCMLSATGELAAAEALELQNHLESCDSCKQALLDCGQFVNAGMAYLASEFAEPDSDGQQPWAQDDAKHELFRRVQAKGAESAKRTDRRVQVRWIGLTAAAALAAALLLAVGYQTGQLKGRHEAASALAVNQSLRERLESLASEKNTLDHKLQTQAASLTELAAKTRLQAEEFAKLRDLEKGQQVQNESLVAENHRQSTAVSSLSVERDSLSGKLQTAQKALHETEVEVTSLRAERQRDLLRYASLETEIRALSTRVKDEETTVTDQRTFLASDRDIRDLMGARDLYIADVFDVDGSGTSKPFGRVFYTKNKSLIFYAFDLDQQPHVRNAAIFQAWGRHGVSDKLPLNMGIFYLDNQANRRWILKFDDPDKLAKIDAVFVTLEPHGGSNKPSGKQLLFASLRSMANHP